MGKRRNSSGPIVAVVDRIDATHRFLASLFFDYVRDQSRCARDYENAVGTMYEFQKEFSALIIARRFFSQCQRTLCRLGLRPFASILHDRM